MNNYDKIKKKIKEYNKNIRYQCIQGLKGPKGDKGELEPGPKVDKGDSSLEPILYNTLFFVNIPETTVAGSAYGKITGVTETNGASFSLYDITNNQNINNLVFELKKENTPDMTFSGVTII